MTLDIQKETLLIIPLYNEEKTITQVVKTVQKYFLGNILIINDGSTDNSIEKIKKCQCILRNINILSHQKNEGYGQALIDGFSQALTHDYNYAITMDCDLQHEPSHIPELLAEIKKYDIVSGSRYLEESYNNSTPPKDRLKINHIITNKINAITGYKLTDAFCGFKAYRMSVLKNMNLSEKGYGFPLQFWIQVFKNKLSVKELPISRIYLNLDRTFGNDLDNPDLRLKYYEKILEKEIAL